jgi:GTP-binding protein HflX
VADLTRSELTVRRERALLVGLLSPNRSWADDDPLAELCGLATTAGAVVVGSLTQRRDRPDVATYLGRGKVAELLNLVQEQDADVVLFDNDLSPSQIRNLEQALKVKVLDRTELILDIFASRAQTYESRLQVELAQLDYALPRLKRMWGHLSRIKGGIGMRGPGEQQLEEDRRIVDRKISELKRKIGDVQLRKSREVASRHAELTVSLVGYTNAGKSTLMNAMTGAGVFVEDKLFATLDTRTRRWQIPEWGTLLLSDTVGFIRDLPHTLVASFRATLEEVRQANLLLHVVDASSPAADEQIAAVQRVLAEIDCAAKPSMLVLNKLDAVRDRSMLDVLRAHHPDAVGISARTGTGLDQLTRAVQRALSSGFVDAAIEFHTTNGRLRSYLDTHALVHSRAYDDGRVTYHCRVPRASLGQILRHHGIVRSDPTADKATDAAAGPSHD